MPFRFLYAEGRPRVARGTDVEHVRLFQLVEE
jgi:hypothetical protein